MISCLKRMAANLIWTLYLFITVYPIQTFGIQSFCMAKSVSVGETAIISCHFNEDLSKPPESDVIVYLYKGNGTEAETVLYYNWINGIPRINWKAGFGLQDNLTDHLVVLIYNVTKEHAGDYKCIAVGYPASLCTLHVKQDFEMPNTTTPMSNTGYTESGSTSKGNNDDISRAENGISTHTVIILCIAVILAVFGAGIIVFAIWKRLIRKPEGSFEININNETNGQCVTFIKQNGSSGNPQFRTVEPRKGATHSNEISCFIPSEEINPLMTTSTQHLILTT